MDFEKNKKKIVLTITGIIILASIAGFFISKYTKSGIPVNKNTAARPIKVYSPEDQKGPYTCPSIKEFCVNGKQITQNGAYIGFGAKIASGSAIYASFDGTINGSTAYPPKNIKGEQTNTIYLDNKEKGLRMVYHFGGNPINIAEKQVKQGEEMAKSGPVIENYNVPLTVDVILGNPIDGNRLHLTPKDFK